VPHLASLHRHKVDRQHHIVLASYPHLDANGTVIAARGGLEVRWSKKGRRQGRERVVCAGGGMGEASEREEGGGRE
jgi:hypothetical protein